MQVPAIGFSREVLGLKDANSTEFDEKTPHPVIAMMEEQKKIPTKGATMRLGNYDCALKDGSKARAAYGEEKIIERHRHRFEFNNEYKEQFEKQGMAVSGTNPESGLCEIMENANHPWFVGVQFHPEFKSRPLRPGPLFKEFVKASVKNKK